MTTNISWTTNLTKQGLKYRDRSLTKSKNNSNLINWKASKKIGLEVMLEKEAMTWMRMPERRKNRTPRKRSMENRLNRNEGKI
jgi:hypothetical protein